MEFWKRKSAYAELERRNIGILEIYPKEQYIFAPMKTRKPILFAQIREAAKRIAKSMDVEQVILFGSFARKNSNGGSDVDLLVVLHPTKRTAEIRYDICTLLHDFPFAVDIVIRTPRQIRSAKLRRDWFTEDAVSKGLLLYAKQAGTH